MKKVILIFTVLLLAASAMADVRIIVGSDGSINYETDGEQVRAFALDIAIDNGTIDGISDYLIGESIDPNTGYGIFPTSFSRYVVVDGDGEPNWSDPNYSPLADPYDPDTLGGLGTAGITIEMGALYYPADDSSPNAPGTSGTLCKLTLSGCAYVAVSENETCGGVVLTDASAVDADLSAAFVRVNCTCDCIPFDHPNYYELLAEVGCPICWCYPRQCHGDADGLKEGSDKKGYYYVHFDDLNVLIAAWNTLEPDKGPGIWTVTGPKGEPGICADFAHDKEGSSKKGYYRVHFSDLNILVAHWNIKEPPHGPGIPPDCGGTIEPEP